MLDSLSFSLNGVLPVFIIIFVGFAARKLRLFDDNFIGVANNLIFKVAFPVLLFKNIYESDIRNIFNLKLVLFVAFSIVLYFAAMAVIVPLFVKDRSKRGALVQASARSNFLLFGLPLAENLFSQAGVAAATLVLAVTIPLFNLCAVFVLEYFSPMHENGKVKVKDLLLGIVKNPLIIGSVVGIVFSYFRIPLPAIITPPIGDLAAVATPMALVLLGGQFDFASIAGNLKYLVFGTVAKLIAAPLIIVTAAILMGFRSYELGAILIMTASPTAVSSYVMAKSMHADHVLAGQLVIFTTFFSIFTVFLAIFVVRFLGFI